jgi:Putative zinc-finger
MECPEIKGYLSEYLDSELDAEKSARIERHLKSCPDCREELDALRKVIETLGSMDAMEAPGGFMEEVHQRIERRSWVSSISRRLFVPFRVKIPIQAASLVTACLLVLLIFHNMRTSKEVVTLMKEPGRRVAAEKAMEAAPEPATPGKVSIPRPALLKAEAVREKRAGKRLQLVFLVSKGSEYAAYRRRKPAPPAEKQTTDRAGITVPGGHDRLSARMNEWTRETHGRILDTQYEETTGRPVRFSVEIPAGQLAAFLEKLSGIGSLKTGGPASPHRTGEMVRLDIRLTYDP